MARSGAWSAIAAHASGLIIRQKEPNNLEMRFDQLDHGPSECDEPMWIYGSLSALARYKNAF
jgi:hypothetical protein